MRQEGGAALVEDGRPAPAGQRPGRHHLGTGIGNEWTLECPADGKFLFKSWKGDYLNRTDSAQAITSAATGNAGNAWTPEFASGKVKLKSVKGDYLNRTDAAQGVNAAATGTGTVWSLEMLPNQ